MMNSDDIIKQQEHSNAALPLLYSKSACHKARSQRTASIELPTSTSADTTTDSVGASASSTVLKPRIARRTDCEGSGRFVWASSRLSKAGSADVIECSNSDIAIKANATGNPRTDYYHVAEHSNTTHNDHSSPAAVLVSLQQLSGKMVLPP
jgi:hypothetical protein